MNYQNIATNSSLKATVDNEMLISEGCLFYTDKRIYIKGVIMMIYSSKDASDHKKKVIIPI